MKKITTLLLAGIPFCMHAQNVGIGTAAPAASAKLEINSANSGLLIPRVALVAVNNGTTPVASPATGVLVYNTNAGVTGGSGEGFYYWDGSAWRRLTANGSGGSANVVTSTTGVSITNGTGQVVGTGNVVIDVASNSSTSPGLVASGAGQNTRVWGTDAAGNPAWRTPFSMLTRYDVLTGTTGVSIVNGTGQVVGGSNMTINVASNSSTSPGLVASGAGQNTQIWGTDAAGNPAWRSPNSMLTRNDIVTATTGVSITNGTGQVVGGSNVSVNVASNSSTSPGLVASGAGQNTRVWGTDAAGNPAWVEVASILDVQNGLNINTTAPNASPANPYVELGGTLIRNTTITQGNFNMVYNLTGTGNFDAQTSGTSRLFVRNTDGFVGVNTNTPTNIFTVNHANTTVATAATYPFAVNRAGTNDYGIGSDASFVYNQSWNNKPLLLNSQNNTFVGINRTTAPIQNLDINGRMNVANGVIQRGTVQINATNDLGLYSQVAGNWIRIASNAAPVKFFTDQGGGNAAGTNAIMSVEPGNGGGVTIAAETTGTGNAGAPNARAALEINSTSKGILTTRLTTAQRDAMGNNLPEGLLIYNTTNDCFEFWDTKATPNGGNGFWNSLCQWCQNVVIVSANQTGFNLNAYIGGGRAEHYCVFVASGVTMQAAGNGGGNSAAGNPGFDASTMPAGATVVLYNYGTILAGGGNGGQGGRESDGVCEGDMAGGAGGAGGDAIRTNGSVPITVYNYGTLRAGGGGGGGGGYGCCSAGGGGGGGAGTPAGTGGGNNRARCVAGTICGCTTHGNSTAGSNGTALTNGVGGAGQNGPNTGCPTCNGTGAGTGGNGGVNAVTGANGTGGNAGGGGTAGLALRGNGSGSSLSNIGGTVTGAVQP